MGFRFQKRIKIFPGVRLNISKSGLGVSVGPRGAKLSVGPTGTFVHTSAVGTGLYYRQKISPNKSKSTGGGGGRKKSLGDVDEAVLNTHLETQSREELCEYVRELTVALGYRLVQVPEKTEEETFTEPTVQQSDPVVYTSCLYCGYAARELWHPFCYWASDHEGIATLLGLAFLAGAIYLYNVW
jgi:hypothetical protein